MKIKYLCPAFMVVLCLVAATTVNAQTSGTVFGWGQNIDQQSTNAGTLSGIQAIAAGSDNTPAPNSIGFSLGLQLDGSIRAWGGNSTYSLANVPTTTNSYFVAIAAGEYHGVALDANGKVYAWGYNNTIYHQTNVPSILSSNVIAIAAGSSGTDQGSGQGTHSLALKNDGTVLAWGKNINGQTNVPVNLSNVVAIAAGGVFSMALKTDGTVVVWGTNTSGVSTHTNVPPSVTNIVAIAAGSQHCLALRTNGTVIAWGSNIYQQTNVPVSASNVVAIAAGDEHSMALRRDGSVVVWGVSGGSQQYTFAVPAGVSNIIAITSSGRHALVISNSAPGITVPPRNQLVYPGSKAVFVVMAAGQGTLTYQWQANGINIPGATGPILVLTNVQPANSGWYQVTVRSTFGSDTASAGLTVQDGRVSITQQPALTNSVDANSNLTVSVTAVGAVPLYFQWWKDGSIIPNATNASYPITNAQFANAGGYFVIVSNVYGAVMSSTDNVGVNYYPPFFVTQPIGTNIQVGGAFKLSAAVTGTSPFGWQWRTNGMAIPGANATNYSISAAQLSDAWTYDVVVTNSNGNGVNSTTSTSAIVNVGYAPVVVQSPISVTNNPGDTVVLSCLVTGTPPITLQWMLNGYPITGQTSSSLTLSNVQSTNIGYYALTATNIFGSAQSSNATLSVTGYSFSQWAGLEAYYALNGDATDSSGYGNDGTNFNVVPTSDRFGSNNGAMYFGGTNNYIQIKTGAYVGTNFTVSAWVNEIAYSNWARIVEFGNGIAHDNTWFAISQGTNGIPILGGYAGTVRTLDYPAGSVVPLNKWVHLVGAWDGIHLSYYTNGVANGSYTASLNRGTIVTSNNYIGRSDFRANGDQDYWGSYDDIRIYNRALSPSEVGQLYAVEADVPVITQQPQAQTVDAGSTVFFSVTATANHPLAYQWRTNDVPIVAATNSSLTLSNVQSANIGFYSVTVSNTFAGVASFGALLNLTGTADPTTNGLIAYYPLNGNANDAGTNGLNGTNNGTGTFWTTNRFGVANSALGLNGSTGYMSVSDTNALLNFDIRSNNYTITTWVLLNNLSSSPCFLIDRGTTLNLASSYDLRYDNSVNRFTMTMWDYVGIAPQDYVIVFSSSAVSSGRWYQIAAVIANRSVSLFVNGINETVPSVNGGVAPAGFASTKNTEGIRDFGRYAWTTFDNYLNGSIDDIRFYNRALSADEVAYLYALESKSTVPPTPTLSVNFGPGPSLNLNLTGVPGSNYVLQAATNLAPPIQWLPLYTNIANTNGVWQFVDTNLNGTQKFYRAIAP